MFHANSVPMFPNSSAPVCQGNSAAMSQGSNAPMFLDNKKLKNAEASPDSNVLPAQGKSAPQSQGSNVVNLFASPSTGVRDALVEDLSQLETLTAQSPDLLVLHLSLVLDLLPVAQFLSQDQALVALLAAETTK